MDRIGDFISDIMKQKMNVKPAEASLVVDRFRDLAIEILGSELVRHVSDVTFRDGVLKIGVLNSVVAQELQIKKIEMLDKLNAAEGEKVGEIVFLVG